MMRATALAITVVAVWGWLGCGAAPKAAPAGPPTAGVKPGAATPAKAQATVAQEPLLEYVPSTAVAAVVIRRGAFSLPRQLLDAAPEMTAELRGYLTSRLGIDLTAVEGLVAYAPSLAGQAGAVFLRLRGDGDLKGRRTGSYRSVPLVGVDDKVVAAKVKGGVVVGTPSGVATAIDLATGRVAPVGPTSALAALRGTERAELVVALHASALTEPPLAMVVRQAGVTAAVLTYDPEGVVTLKVHGDAQRLGALQQMFQSGAGVGLQALERAKTKAKRGDDVGAAVGAILTFHQAQRLFQEVAPRLEGDTLVSRYRLPQLTTSSAFLVYGGVAAAVAIPTFVKYLRRSKAMEARTNLTRLATAVRARAGTRRRGRRFSFPASTPWSPSQACCSQPTNPKCAPSPDAFAHPTWKALDFSLADPHYYQYRFISTGRGKKAHFTLEARGDLDCDGETSHFRITGRLASDGSVVTGPLEVERETE